MRARIYQPAKTAMQSGRAKVGQWLIEFEPAAPRGHEPLMGWTSSSDTARQVRLDFASREAAIAFAERRGMEYEVQEPHERKIRGKSYAANFRWDQAR